MRYLSQSFGNKQSNAELNLYPTSTVTILLYFDDLQIFRWKKPQRLKNNRKDDTQWWASDRGDVGMNIDTTEVGFSLYQTPYIETLLQQYGMTDVYGVGTPVDARVPLGVAETTKRGLWARRCARRW